MPGTADFIERVLDAAGAGEALVVVGNVGDVYFVPELDGPLRLPELLALLHARAGRTPILYSLGAGARPLTPPGHAVPSLPLPDCMAAPGDAIPALLAAAREHRDPVVLIVDHADDVVPRLPAGATPSIEQAVVAETLAHAAIDPAFEQAGNALVLIARSGEISPALTEASGFRVERVPLPAPEDVERTLELLAQRAGEQPDRYAALAPDVPLADATAHARGLRSDDLVRAARSAAAAGQGLALGDLERRKAASIERQARGTLQLRRPGYAFEGVAGLPHVKRYVEEHRHAAVWPSTLLLAGPPGVGKTFVVRAIAATLGRPLVTLGLVRSPWVGESEANLARALGIVDELAPIVVHIDEVDQAIGQRSTGQSSDGGTSERLLASLWEFTGEGAARREVLFCLTTNRPDLLDAAQRNRAELLPILHPTASEVAALLPVLAAQQERVLAESVDAAAIAAHAKLDMTSARHLHRILARAARLADAAAGRPGAPIGQAQLLASIDEYLPHTDREEEELMALSTLERTSFESLLPWWTNARDGGEPEVPGYVRPLLRGGRLDPQRLRERLDELSARSALRRTRKAW